LKATGSSAGKLIGAATQSGFLTDTRYTTILDREFNYLTAEYEMKWNAIEGSPGASNFSESRRARCVRESAPAGRPERGPRTDVLLTGRGHRQQVSNPGYPQT
jgi:endo-1,4-beta-xylanase